MRVGLIMEQVLARVPGGTGRYSAQVAAALGRVAPGAVEGWVAWRRDVSAAAATGVLGPRRLPLPRQAVVAAWETGYGPVPRGDVVHAPTLLVPPRRGRPLVVTIHDVVPWTHPETLTPRGVAWHRKMAARAAATADRLVVPSEAVADQLVLHLGLDRRPDVVELGATPLPLPDDAERRAAVMGLPAGGYVLSLATAEPRKGLDVLVAAMVDDAAPDLPLVTVGAAGWGGVSPSALADRAGLPADRLLDLGRVPDEDLAVVLSRASVLAVPSRAEGFGLPVLEGMAAGVPVVTSDDAALREVGGDACYVAPVGDAQRLAAALGLAATAGADRDRHVADGLSRARRYTWDATARKLLALYEAVR